MIIVQLKGGLGNQLFQFAFGASLAASCCEELVLDASYYSIHTAFHYGLDGLGIQRRVIREPEDVVQLAFCRLDKYLKYLPSIGNVCIERRDGRIMCPSDFKGRKYFSGYWQNYRYFCKSRAKILSELSTDLPKKYDAYLKECQDESVCSVHVRRGDFLKDARTRTLHGGCTPEYYLEAERTISAIRPIRKIYVFSDDPKWVRDNVKFKAEVAWLSPASAPVEDLLAISKPMNRIISNSTFSWWGAWIGNEEGALTVAPKRWGGGSYLSRIDIVPSEWLRV